MLSLLRRNLGVAIASVIVMAAIVPAVNASPLDGTWTRVGLAKPDPRIYRLALERLRVAPEQAVFIDDVAANVEGARQVGMHAIRFQSPAQTRQELASLLNGRAA